MALVHNNQVEKVAAGIPCTGLVEVGVFRQCLVNGKVHLAALIDFSPPPPILKRASPNHGKGFVLRVIDQHLVRSARKRILRAQIFPRAIPSAVPKLPADLKGDKRLAGASGHGEE